MAAQSNGVPGLLRDANTFPNGNGGIHPVDDSLDVIVEEKMLVHPELFTIDLSNDSSDIKSCNSDSDYSGAVSRSSNSSNSKPSEVSNSTVDTKGSTYNNSRRSEGYSTGHEDLSGFEGAPLSMESFVPKEDDDEYFEEFHLPNTYENTFVRHQSFRKKVQLTPIIAPDAEKIEGLVRTGSFRRHNSIRRKILHEEPEFDLDDTDSESSLSEQLRQDIEEIEQIIQNESETNSNSNNEAGRHLVNYSTPINRNTPVACEPIGDLHFSELDLSQDHSLSIEQVTLMKIKDCLDITKYRNIYHLSGRLQDILSAQEIEEVLNNSEKYSSFLTAEVMEALSMSLHENTLSDDVNARLPSDHVVLEKSSEVYNSCASSLDLKVIQAPKLDLNAIDDTMDDSEITEMSDVEIPNSDYLSSTGMMEDSVDRTKHQRRISVEGVSFTSVSCYSAPSGASEEPSQEIISATSYPSHFSRPLAENPFPPPPPDLIPESNDALEENHWRNVVIAGDWKQIDMKAVHPYKSFISYGGFSESGSQVIVVSASLLPKRALKDYNYIMDNLFMYALSILEQLVSEDYILVYLAGGRATNGPGFHWMRKAYDMIDRRIRKNMKKLLIVHPSLWARTLVILAKPFISSKFYRKLGFVYNLTDLAQIVPLNSIQIPESITQLDFELMINEKKRAKRNRNAL